LNIYIIIPAHNEEDSIGLTLESLANQTLLPKRVVVVNDNSTDSTQKIIEKFTNKHHWISLVNNQSSDTHLPGTKIINAFYKGFKTLDDNYDVICKFDADLIFSKHYLETISNHFKQNDKLGMASGFCYIKKNDDWVLENLTRKDHIRGALKAYKKDCFLQIGKLKPAMGWDTIDELLAKYYDWELLTDENLKVKHLKPTGKSYNKASKYLQGEAMYKIRLGIILTGLTGLKMTFKKHQLFVLTDYIFGYYNAKRKNIPYLINKEQGKFIRKLRWKGVFNIN
jgi:glycosyltransferase involved in cell wall biosynthesis